ESIGSLHALISLQLQFTNVAAIPASIGNLTKLESLGVYGSENEMQWDSMDPFPSYYGQDEQTEKHSPFTGLPGTAANLKALKFLKLCETEIDSLPDYLSALPALEEINIRGCKVKTILPSLQKLADNDELTIIKDKDDERANSLPWRTRKRRRP
ncbi:MAG: hypothetical protein LBC77_02680, partial [Spirochaetaceae bacterium]|nr:hypothetical protein [Spirochaetaceae bacterium]